MMWCILRAVSLITSRRTNRSKRWVHRFEKGSNPCCPKTRMEPKSSSTACPKTRTEPKARILEAFSKFAETSRRGTGSAIGDPEQTSPPDHPFRPACAHELLCGVAVVITEQAAQSLATSHVPVETADAFFRFDQRVPEPLMVALSMMLRSP